MKVMQVRSWNGDPKLFNVMFINQFKAFIYADNLAVIRAARVQLWRGNLIYMIKGDL
jgi:hypothetical protein